MALGHCTPHGDDEWHGKVGDEAVVDAEGYITLTNGLGDDGQGGVHGSGSACGDGGEWSEPFGKHRGEQQCDHLAHDVGKEGDCAKFGSTVFGYEDARE